MASVTLTTNGSAGLRAAITSTCTVIEVRPIDSMRVKKLSTSPTDTGCLNWKAFTATVATRPRARRAAAMPPAMST